MKRLLPFAILSAILAGCAVAPPNPPYTATDANGVPLYQTSPRTSVGVEVGRWGGHGYGGVGFGLGW